MIKEVRKEVYNCVPYAAGKSMEDVMEEYGLSSAIKLGSNENPYAPFHLSTKRMMDEVLKINSYPEKNFIRLKSILAERNNLAAENIGLGHGAGGVLDTLAKTFISHGDEVIVPKETYGLYNEISKGMGAEVKQIPLDGEFRLDLQAMAAAVSEKTKLIWVCNPNNPTGTTVDRNEFYAFIDALPNHVWVILDEAYIEFAKQDHLIDVTRLISEGKKIIKVGTLSKYFGLAGGRIGYCIARPEVITAYDTISEPFNANRIGLAGAVSVLTEDLATCISYGNRLIASRESMIAELREAGCACSESDTNFVFFSTDFAASDIANRLLQQGVIVRPCGGWGYQNHLRVTIGTEEQNKVFIDKFKSVLQTLQGA
ncbi:histidinol-phosphate transaminase [Erwinia sp. INIA-01]|uniref:histidinol-phosphate transaminase n=1 Tax=Erwinia sp. INIA01 TaxID=2991500 RepID=UPI00222440F3|nr:histidinol-phosphate transaminase [Erwinia sp. INIA01]MCW1877435.1 histidinol-phosphate transaminase [Erwinia sp. INIA01]